MISGRTPLTYDQWRQRFTSALEHAADGALVLGYGFSPTLEDALVEVIDAEPADRADATARAWNAFHVEHPKP
ncbi:hypothetical protein [Prescottella equi]|uniref:hypothetical protein n=1 Tax=Rhodococcus hoagii TaxID=43767 RepID=UPI00301E565C